jgi:hypothetical protein
MNFAFWKQPTYGSLESVVSYQATAYDMQRNKLPLRYCTAPQLSAISLQAKCSGYASHKNWGKKKT